MATDTKTSSEYAINKEGQVYRTITGTVLGSQEVETLGIDTATIPDMRTIQPPQELATPEQPEGTQTVGAEPTTTVATADMAEKKMQEIDETQERYDLAIAKKRLLAEQQELEFAKETPEEIRDVTLDYEGREEIEGFMDSGIKHILEKLDVTTLDEEEDAAVEHVKMLMRRRKEEMQKLNQSIIGSKKILGVTTGRQRYAPELQKDILDDAEIKAAQRITDLETEETQLIAQIKAARDAKELQLLNQRFAMLGEVHDRKMSEIYQLESLAIQKENQLLQRQQFEFSKQESLRSRIFQIEQMQREEEQLLETGRQSIMLQIAQNGAPEDILSSLTGATSIEDAITIATPWLKDPLLELQIQQARANIAKTYFDMQQARKAQIQQLLDEAEERDSKALEHKGAMFGKIDVLKLLDEIENHKAFSAAVGPLSGKIVQEYASPFIGIPGPMLRNKITGEMNDFNAKLQQLENVLVKENLHLIKGTLSDGDIALMKNAMAALRVRTSEENFKNELAVIRDKMDRSYKNDLQKYPEIKNLLLPEEESLLFEVLGSDIDDMNNYYQPTLIGSSSVLQQGSPAGM